jgi:hypothetical protein
MADVVWGSVRSMAQPYRFAGWSLSPGCAVRTGKSAKVSIESPVLLNQKNYVINLRQSCTTRGPSWATPWMSFPAMTQNRKTDDTHQDYRSQYQDAFCHEFRSGCRPFTCTLDNVCFSVGMFPAIKIVIAGILALRTLREH